jgi:hypothetical protein
VRATFERVAQAAWPVLAGVLVGLAAGGIWTLAQPERHRAEARVLVRGAEASRVVPAVEALAESSLLEQNVAQTLHLSPPPQVTATRGQGGVLTLSVEAGSRERARQIDAEVTVVLTQLVASRFRQVPLEATVLDPAHTVEQTSPTPGRNLLIAGLGGLVLGLAAAAGVARRRELRFPAGVVDPSLERRLRARIDAVAKRERALARRAGELAARERRLDEHERSLRERPAERPAQPEPEPRPEPPAELVPGPPAVPLPASSSGRWNLSELERAVEADERLSAERKFELRAYLLEMRQFAETDGTLPRQFDALIEDVFGDTIA